MKGVCPVDAISADESQESGVGARSLDESFSLHFDLVACKMCGAPFATEGEMARLKELIPPEVQKDSSGLEWMKLCPALYAKSPE